MQWLGYIEQRDCRANEIRDPYEKSAFISTSKAGVHLAVSLNEYLQLQTLLRKADCEVKALDMLALFEG
ncbi:MAG: hypothetical protein INR73_20200 [Williamsia sp.]|nr:hypothetical protein [Williamsia sp.]